MAWSAFHRPDLDRSAGASYGGVDALRGADHRGALVFARDGTSPPAGSAARNSGVSLPPLLAEPWAALLTAIEALGRSGATDALAQLGLWAGEGNPALQALCSTALSTPVSRQALLDALKDPDPRVALAAARTLAQFPGNDASAAWAEVVRSGDPSIRATALQAWMAGGAAEAVSAARVALRGSDAELAFAAAESLSASPLIEARLALEQASMSSDPAERAAVARALALLAEPGPEALRTMLVLAADPQPEVRQPALSALSQSAAPEAAGPVLEAARVGPSEDRAAALELLGNMPDRQAGAVIADSINDASPIVATAAIRAAEYRLGSEVDDAVAARLIDPGSPPELALAAARTLLRHGGPLARLYAGPIAATLAGSSGEP
jgi:hypothetical protein